MERKYGWQRDFHDERDVMAPDDLFSAAEFKEINLRPGCPPIFDQGSEGSCVANALCLAAGYSIRVPLSRQFLYYNARKMRGLELEDSGCQIRDAIKSFASTGVCPERAWEYRNHWRNKPETPAYREANYFKVVKYRRVPKSRKGLLSQLAAGHPVVLGVQIFAGFEQHYTEFSGEVSLPKKGEAHLGGHAITIVGSTIFLNGEFQYVFANSWGKDWGDQGFGFIPEDYLLSDLSSDWWSIESIELPVEKEEKCEDCL